jgi:hypothetical protein
VSMKLPYRKYRNTPTTVNGIRFDSKMEAKRWGELCLLQKAGAIAVLERQVTFDLVVNGQHVCCYRCDFRYWDVENNALVVEDAKGFRTPEYKIKRALMAACLGIEVREV